MHIASFQFSGEEQSNLNAITMEGASVNASRPSSLVSHHGDFPSEEIN